MSPQFGWPQDAVDGSLLALVAAEFLRASQNGQAVQARALTQRQIGITDFFSEGVTISALQRLGVRNLAAGMGLEVKSGEEVGAIPRILSRLQELSQAAGGEPPTPDRPDDAPVRELQELGGNQQFVAVHDKRNELLKWHNDWSDSADTIQQRLPQWQRLETLLKHAQTLPIATEVEAQVEAILANRSLLETPDLVTPLIGQLTTALRAAANDAHQRLRSDRDREVGALEASDEWQRLSTEDQQRVLTDNGLQPISPIDLSTDEALLATLEATSLQTWEIRVTAVQAQAAKARQEAARILEPKAVTVRPTAATLKTKEDVEAYVERLRAQLLEQVANNPVVIV